MPFLFTSLEKNLKLIEESLGITASYRGDRIFLKGDDDRVRTAEKLIMDLRDISFQGYTLRPEDIRFAVRAVITSYSIHYTKLYETCRENFHRTALMRSPLPYATQMR